MTATFAHDPGQEPAWNKLDEAMRRGFDPGEDYGDQPTGPMSPSVVRWVHQGSTEGCDQCGERCDDCGDRMCATWGPDPRACGVTCDACPCRCRKCIEQQQDMRDELTNQLERESR